jgi:uncharacterized membrane protein YphA (DoxX/SURF4 family)
MMLFSASMKFMNPPEVSQQFEETLGYPANLLLAIGIVEIACVVFYAIPYTAVLGAVVLTGYLGGAIATHERIGESFMAPAIAGIFVWLGIYLREPRLRALLPIRRPIASTGQVDRGQ